MSTTDDKEFQSSIEKMKDYQLYYNLFLENLNLKAELELLTNKPMGKSVEFRKVLGHRVYLEIPEEPKSAIHMDQATKDAMEAERLRKWGRLRVYAVGDSVPELKQGDIVMIDPSSMSRAYRIPITADKDVLLVSFHDIAHIW